jgi:4-aminobutyrate aminotransferase-like enzyme
MLGNSNFYNPPSDIEFVSAKGIYLYDKDGNEFIDCAAGTFNLSVGNSNEEVINAAFEQAKKMVHLSSSFKNKIIDELAQKLIDIAPNSLNRVHLKATGGSTANELAIKMAMNYTGKSEVISLFKAHHGQTFATTQYSGLSFRKEKFNFNSFNSLIVPSPECNKCFYGQKRETCNLMCVNRVDDFINFASNGNIAAFIIEPILGNGDNIIPPIGYLQAIRDFCTTRNIVLIFDEVQTGVGRTGHMFASQYFEVQPDILTLSKGLGAGFPMAAVLCNEKFMGLGTEHVSFTYGGNLVSAAASLKAIEIIEKPAFLENVQKTGNYILERLKEFESKYPFIVYSRGVGLMIGFEIVDSKGNEDLPLTLEIVKIAFQRKMLLRTSRYGRGNLIKIRPSLNITMVEAERICNTLKQIFETINQK